MLGTNLVEDIVSFDLIPHTSIYEAKWLRKFKNIVLAALVDGVALWSTVCPALLPLPSLGVTTFK